jgi:hypothetical protein
MGSLEYAHARLSARFGARPDELAWRRIEHLRDAAALIDAARTSAFARWITRIEQGSPPHAIDRELRDRFREQVAEVAAWMPEAWRPAILWCATAVDLPAVSHLARGGAALPWMRDDAAMRDLTERESAGLGATPAGGALAPLSAAWADPERLADLWRAEWRRRIPRRAGGEPTLLDALARAIAAHRAALRDPALSDGTALRRALQARLTLLFRRAVLDPAAAFVFVAQIGLDLERLRAELLRRAAFPAVAPGLEAAA